MHGGESQSPALLRSWLPYDIAMENTMGAGNRRRGDRLSDLPEPILHHILSFLDTRSVVQTSLLSRSWRSAWKNIPVLHLCSNPFKQYPVFKRYVDKVLSLRGELKLRKLIYFDDGVKNELEPLLFVRVIDYALRHDTQHLAIDLDHVRGNFERYYRFSYLFGSNVGCNNLRTLELACVYLDSGFPSFGFRMLTTLKMDSCELSFDSEGGIDPFSNFPGLQNLALRNCGDEHLGGVRERWFKVSGLQLLSLVIESIEFCRIQVFAPKLKSFRFREDAILALESLELGLPSLNHADIFVSDWLVDDETLEKERWISLFRDLHNVKSLTLHSKTIQALSNISEFLERQPSPFMRLKHLILRSNKIHHKVVNFFLKGSSGAEPIIEFVQT